MGFKKFVPASVGKGGSVRGGEAPRNEPWGTIETNGASGYIMHLGVDAVRQFKLKEGDRVSFYFDAATNRIGVNKEKDGEFSLTKHGGNPNRLKVSITEFFRKVAGDQRIKLPHKRHLVPGRSNSPVLFTMSLDPLPKRGSRRAAVATPEPEPAPDPAVESKRSRKTSRPAPEPVAS